MYLVRYYIYQNLQSRHLLASVDNIINNAWYLDNQVLLSPTLHCLAKIVGTAEYRMQCTTVTVASLVQKCIEPTAKK